MSQEVAVRNESPMPALTQNTNIETAIPSHMVIPRVLIMQPTSEAVGEGTVTPFIFVKSDTMEKLGGDKDFINIIPITYKTVWTKSEKVGDKFEYRGTEPLLPYNSDLPWEYLENGKQMRRDQTIELYCLLEKDIQADIDNFNQDLPDVNKVLLPCVVSFRRTSFGAGKDIVTFFGKVQQIKVRKPSVEVFNYTIQVGMEKKKNEKGLFGIFISNISASTTKPEFVEVAKRWHQTILSSIDSLRVDAEAPESVSGNITLEEPQEF